VQLSGFSLSNLLKYRPINTEFTIAMIIIIVYRRTDFIVYLNKYEIYKAQFILSLLISNIVALEESSFEGYFLDRSSSIWCKFCWSLDFTHTRTVL